MPEALSLTKIRINRAQSEGTHSGLLKSPTAEDKKTPPPKTSLKKSVSFQNAVQLIQTEERQG
jgi:hypothetical protein